MRVADAETTLREMALTAVVDPGLLDVGRAWPVFAKFMEIPAEDAPRWRPFRDGMFLHWGTYDWRDGQGLRFQIGFTRQFSLYQGDEYDHTEQLSWTFFFDPTAERTALGSGDLWGEPESPATRQAWRDEVEAHRVFQIALASGRPAATRIVHSEV